MLEELAQILRVLVSKAPMSRTPDNWDEYCLYCYGERNHWLYQHEDDCPWWRLKQLMEVAPIYNK